MSFPNAEKVCRLKEPLQWTPEKQEVMVEACREMAVFHYENSDDIRQLYDARDFDPESVLTEADLNRIPFLGVTAMKHFLFTSMEPDQAVLKLTSSGTSGQKTQIWFDQESLDRVQSQMDSLWGPEGLVNDTPTNYCNFIYDPEDARDLGIAFSVKNEERFAPAAESFFTVRKNKAGAWEFDKAGTVAKLREFAGSGRPTRVLGIPSFLFELIEYMRENGEAPIELGSGSWLLTGGGWKAAEDKKVSREEFRKRVAEALGIRDENMRDGFGMAEHSAPYMECPSHRLHVPVFNRVVARNPVTLEALAPGEPGLLEFITPYNAMMPNLAILSTDMGYVNAEACDCGRNSPTFTLLGRGGLKKHKGCAITANEIVKRN